MRLYRGIAIAIVLLGGLVLGTLILRSEPGPTDTGQADGDPANGSAETVVKGPHGGRLLTDGAFQVELSIFERGVPPEFRLRAWEDGEPIPPGEVAARVRLRRLSGRIDEFRFRPESEFLVADAVVEEPHSFDVTVEATWSGRRHTWEYGSYDGRVEISAETAARSGVEVETAGPATLESRLRLNGLIVPNEDHLTHVLPRFPGIVKDARKRIGDRVAKGEVMAIVQSNQSLEPYEVRSEIAGTVIQKHVTSGEFVGEGHDLYTVADLGTVWVDLNVYRQDFSRLSEGQPVILDAGEGIAKVEGRIAYISPFGAPNTQTMLARVVLPNSTGEWRPGLFVSGEVIVDQAAVPLAVRSGALQEMGGETVVFIRAGDTYEAQPIEIGRRDGEWVEVLAGLDPGQAYVAKGSFILKADVGKSGASHDH